jgi:hypothetical protein
MLSLFEASAAVKDHTDIAGQWTWLSLNSEGEPSSVARRLRAAEPSKFWMIGVFLCCVLPPYSVTRVTVESLVKFEEMQIME